MKKNVFLSTGGFYKDNIIQVVNFFIKNDIFNIELSGGPYEKNVYNKLIDLKKSPAITDLDKLTALGTAGLIMNELKTIINLLYPPWASN